MSDFISHRLKASDIMESCLSYIYPHTRVNSIVGILRTTAHNAFPVVTIDKNTQQEVHENNYPSNLDSSNERFARTTTFSNLISEQKLRRHIVSSGEDSTLAHRIRTSSDVHSRSHHMDIRGKRLKSDSDKDYLTYSSSAPGLSSLINEDPEWDKMQADHDGKANVSQFCTQSNLSTMATLGTEVSGCCREVAVMGGTDVT